MDESSIDHRRSIAKMVARQLERDDRVEDVSDGFIEEYAESEAAKRAESMVERGYYGTPKLKPVHSRATAYQKMIERREFYD